MLATRNVSWGFVLKAVVLPLGFLCGSSTWGARASEITIKEVPKKEAQKNDLPKKEQGNWDQVFQNLPWVPNLVLMQAGPAPLGKIDPTQATIAKPAATAVIAVKPTQAQSNATGTIQLKPVAGRVTQINPSQAQSNATATIQLKPATPLTPVTQTTTAKPAAISSAPVQALTTERKSTTPVISSDSKPLTIVIDPAQAQQLITQGQNGGGITVIRVAEPNAPQPVATGISVQPSPRPVIRVESQPPAKPRAEEEKRAAREKERGEAEKKRDQAQAERDRQRVKETSERADAEKRRIQAQAEREKQRAWEARESQLKAMMEDLKRARAEQQKKAEIQGEELRALKMRLQQEMEQKTRLAEKQKMDLDRGRTESAEAKKPAPAQAEKSPSKNNINVLSIQIDKVFEIKRVGEAFNLKSTVTLGGPSGKADAPALAMGLVKPLASLVLPVAGALPSLNVPPVPKFDEQPKTDETPSAKKPSKNDAQKLEQMIFQQSAPLEKAPNNNKDGQEKADRKDKKEKKEPKEAKESKEKKETQVQLELAQERLREHQEVLKKHAEEQAKAQMLQAQALERRALEERRAIEDRRVQEERRAHEMHVQEMRVQELRRNQEDRRILEDRQREELEKTRQQSEQRVRAEERKRFESIVQEIRGHMEVEKRKSEEMAQARDGQLKKMEAELRTKQDQLEKLMAQHQQRIQGEWARPTLLNRPSPDHRDSAGPDGTQEASEQQRNELKNALARLTDELDKKQKEAAHIQDVIQTLRNRLGQLEGPRNLPAAGHNAPMATLRLPAPPRPPEPFRQNQPFLQTDRNLEKTVDQLAGEIKEIRALLNELRQRPNMNPPAPPFYYGPYPNPMGYGPYPPPASGYYPHNQPGAIPTPTPMTMPLPSPETIPSPNAVPSSSGPTPSGRTRPATRPTPGASVTPPRVPAPPEPADAPAVPRQTY